MNYDNELLVSQVTSLISELVPVDVEKTKNKLSVIFNQYDIRKVEKEEVHPDLYQKINMYVNAKKLEGLSDATLNGYQLELNLFANRIKKKAESVTVSDIRIYLAELEHLKMSTIGQKLSILKSFFAWLHSEELIERNPTLKLKTPKTEKRLPKALTIEELEMLREACQTVRQRAFIEILYATGCRLSEVYGLDKDDINFQSMSTNVIGKGNKEREVYLSFKALYHLKKYLKSRNDNCNALMITHRKPYRRLSKRGIQYEINQIAKNAGLEKRVSPHTLRHTFATLTLNNGAELVAIQELLGHSSPEVTLRYARITEERKREQHKKFLVQ
ncbi:tyrosine-type recombinase/integrase [Priestia flexa]|uniref:site-specific tyrosine recombinase/integron integrase n=1 Tax=Priestia flexa TaxID=86664 RepID=UPI000C23035A|nr:site-specific tyrosine recombinase/integron integrase [Priestia flexa]MEC0665383.1 tyrosine-type recombinase/integrase [Priestia flexa]